MTVNGQRIELSTNRFVEISKWSTEAGKMKGSSEEARSINTHLDMFKIKIIDIQMELIHKNINITSEALKNRLLGTQERQRTLIPIFKDHNNKIKELVGKEYAPGTLERYNTSLKHTIEFLEWKYKISDIKISKIDHAFITEYEFYLRSVRNCANNTAVKYIKNFSKIIKICLANHWIDRNPFANYKSKVKEVERVYLSEGEIQNIINKDFKTERLSLVRDIFLFSCFTGLAYIDVKNLTKSHISIGIDGEKWIFTHRQKTETASKIPILPLTQMIIDKYEDHQECNNQNKLLPILSNQKMNAYLKEIAGICEIEKELTFNIARHTFATTVTLTNGVPIESVSKMLCHKNLRTTQHYAKVLDKKVSEDMKILRDKFAAVTSQQNKNIN
ncbi:site-specific integrase [Flavobacterium petrolei]|uniref:site-specific integrase n=1 Tax=Flavobacterium petrolei TaxID=2259594 RepID=UPI002939524C|nr:site-specific integrase [Flavobacterium petrolei]